MAKLKKKNGSGVSSPTKSKILKKTLKKQKDIKSSELLGYLKDLDTKSVGEILDGASMPACDVEKGEKSDNFGLDDIDVKNVSVLKGGESGFEVEKRTYSRTSSNFTSIDTIEEQSLKDGSHDSDTDRVVLPFIDYLLVDGRIANQDLITAPFGAIVEIGDNIKVKIQDYGNRWFKRMGDVYECGRKIGVLQWNKNIGNDIGAAQYQVANELFYTVQYLGDRLRQNFDDLTFDLQHVTRIDLALDNVELIPHLEAFLRKDVGKAGSSDITFRFDSDCNIIGFNSGSRRYRYVRYYNKTKQLAGLDVPKTYIEKIHKAEGLGVDDDVFRLEIELKRDYLKTLDGFNLWDLLEDGESYLKVWATVSKGFLEFFEKTGQENKSREARVWTIHDVFGFINCKYQRVYEKCKDGYHSAKVALKSLFRLGCLGNSISVKSSIGCFLSNFPLHDWYFHSVGRWGLAVGEECHLKGITYDAKFLLHGI